MSGGQRTGGHLSGNTLGYQIAIGTASSSPGQPKKTTVPGLPLMARYSFSAAAAASVFCVCGKAGIAKKFPKLYGNEIFY